MVLLPLGTFFAADNSSTDELNEHSATTENLLQDLSENPVVSNVYDANKKVIDKCIRSTYCSTSLCYG